MESFKSSPNSMSNDLNILHGDTENIDSKKPAVIKNEIDDGFIAVEIKQEHIHLPRTVLLEADTTLIKVESVWDAENTSTYEHDKPEFVQFKGKDELILNFPDKTSFDESKHLSPELVEVPVKTENCDSEIEKIPEMVVLDGWKIKSEEVDLKTEDSGQSEISKTSCGIDQARPEGYKKHKCHMCDYRTKYKSDLNRHLKRRHKNPNEDLTKVKIPILKMPTRRRKNRKNPTIFQCDECEYQTLTKYFLEKHLLRHKSVDEVDMFKCDQCSYKSIDKELLQMHQQRHKDANEVDMFTCAHCDYKCCVKAIFKKHLTCHKIYEEKDLLPCDKCDYRARRKGDLKKHLLRHRDREEVEIFKCNQCSYKSILKGTLISHQLRHKNAKGSKTFECNECDYKSFVKENFKLHLIRHKPPEEIKFLQCDKCEYRTRLRSDLKKHFLRHRKAEEAETLHCAQCDFTTIYKTNLKLHRRQHRNK